MILSIINIQVNPRCYKCEVTSYYLRQKAVLYGKEYMKVPAKDTTQTCSGCGHVMKGEEKIPLGAEEWTCPVCGIHHLRDYNSARNVLKRGLVVKAQQI